MSDSDFLPAQRRLMDFVKERFRPVYRNYHISKLVGDASTRQYFRLETQPDESFIIAVYPEPFEPETFTYLQIYQLLRTSGLPVPEIRQMDGPRGIVVQEDLGNVSLQRRLIGLAAAERRRLLEQAMDHIVILQDEGTRRLNPAMEAYGLAFDFEKLSWELEFFRKHFLQNYRQSGRRDSRLDEEFTRLATELAAYPRVLCHRDYHVRNLMCFKGQLYIIDFQDARWGPPAYDVVSLLKDSLDLGAAEIEHLIAYYLQQVRSSLSAEEFERQFHLMCIQRLLKALGTYGYQITVRSNHIYEQYVGGSLERVLISLLALTEFPAIRGVVERELGVEYGSEAVRTAG